MSRTGGLLSIGFKGNRRNWWTPFLGHKKKRFSKILQINILNKRHDKNFQTIINNGRIVIKFKM